MSIEQHDYIPDHNIAAWFDLAKQLFKDGKTSHHISCPSCSEKWTIVYKRGKSTRMVDQQCNKCRKQFRTLCQRMK